MGVFVKNAFSAKNPTMQVFSDDGGWSVIPLKKIFSELVFVKIKGVLYLFHIDARAFHTYRYFGSKPIQTILFSTKDAYPIIPNDIVDLVNYTAKINNAKITPELGSLILKASNLEGVEEGKAVSVMEVVKAANIGKKMQLEPTVQQLEHKCGLNKIIVPLPSISRLLHDRMLASPQLLASGYEKMQAFNVQLLKVANPATTPFKHYMWLILGVVVIGGLLIGVVILNDMGYFGEGGGLDFNKIVSEFPDFTDYQASIGAVVPGLVPTVPLIVEDDVVEVVEDVEEVEEEIGTDYSKYITPYFLANEDGELEQRYRLVLENRTYNFIQEEKAIKFADLMLR